MLSAQPAKMFQESCLATIARLRNLFCSETVFVLGLASVLVRLRYLLFDQNFFKGYKLPNHDMSHGVSFFATNMHSVKMTGELAFWNPCASNGYAQCFQSFLSPLAPTPNNIVFILWAEAVSFLHLLNINIAEYQQYIAYTYTLAPFLTFVACILFFRQLFENRWIVAILMTCYAFSSIGIWNSAWFYFQEPFTLFCVLGSAIAFFRKPTASSLLLVLAAVLIQLCSLNYWTIHNSWFYAIVFGSYALAFPNQMKRAVNRVALIAAKHKRTTVLIAAIYAVTLAVWSVCLGSMFFEQSKYHIRYTITSEQYNPQQLLDRVHELRSATIEFFNPSLEKAHASYPYENDMHNARYIGLAFLPFLLLLPLYKWRRKERFLTGLLLSTLVICIGFPLIGLLWASIPILSRDQHLLYFYSQYLQLGLIMAAGAALETILNKDSNQKNKGRMTSATLFLLALVLVAFTFCEVFSSNFPAKDVNLQAIIYSATILLAVCVFLLQHLLSNNANSGRMLLAALALINLMDLTGYFAHVNQKDADFLRDVLLPKWYRRQVHNAAYAPIRNQISEPTGMIKEPWYHHAQLSKCWSQPDMSLGFSGGIFRNMPIFTSLWPTNRFLMPKGVVNLHRAPEAVQEYEYLSPSLQLASQLDERFNSVPGIGMTPISGDPEIDSIPEAGSRPLDARPFLVDRFVRGFNYQFTFWSYNKFRVKLDAPASGKLLIHQLPDPLWEIRLDGQAVSAKPFRCVDMVIPLERGTHTLEMNYLPLVRRFYWTAAILLQITLGILLIAYVRSRYIRNRSHPLA